MAKTRKSKKVAQRAYDLNVPYMKRGTRDNPYESIFSPEDIIAMRKKRKTSYARPKGKQTVSGDAHTTYSYDKSRDNKQRLYDEDMHGARVTAYAKSLRGKKHEKLLRDKAKFEALKPSRKQVKRYHKQHGESWGKGKPSQYEIASKRHGWGHGEPGPTDLFRGRFRRSKPKAEKHIRSK